MSELTHFYFSQFCFSCGKFHFLTTEGAFHFAGKQFLTDLQPAAPYRARVSAKNGEGWGKPGPEWNFATKGTGW